VERKTWNHDGTTNVWGVPSLLLGAPLSVTCLFSIFVRLDSIGYFRPALFLYPLTIHPLDSYIAGTNPLDQQH
jgi:hypothetical protein